MSGVTPNPAAAFSTLAIDEIDVVVRDERGQAAPHELAPRPPDDVADEEERVMPR